MFIIMDDEEVIRKTISDMLESLGYTVECKENGREVVDFFTAEIEDKRNVSGMIFDLTIQGGMGGKAAVGEIRKLNTEIPVLWPVVMRMIRNEKSFRLWFYCKHLQTI